jgi:CubicO group peptidase (beta-lactamase class C family)
MKHYFFWVSLLVCSYAYSQDDLSESIDRILNSQINSSSEPGLTVGVVQNGKLVYKKSKGLMNLEYGLHFNDSTVFGLASITKQFTSACIGILEKQGKLSINDDVRKYIPEMGIYSETIRIKHLLNHTSGIRNHNVLLNLSGFDYEHRGYTNKIIEELMFKQRGVNNIPGDKMLYSNTNYVLLALIIKRVSGMEIHEFAKQELFIPLKMTNTFYKNSLEDIIKNRAYSYYANEGEYKNVKSLTHCIGAGGMGSTIDDLAKWSNLFLNPNHDFSYLKEFITELDTLNNGERMKHAKGMFVSPFKGYKTFNHSGRDLGMRSQFICIPKKDIAVIVFTNSENINAVEISYQILDLFLNNSDINQNEINRKFEHSKDQIRNMEGVFQELNSDLRMEIFLENDTLKAISSFGRTPNPLVSQTSNSLCRKDNPSIVYTFHSEEESEVDLWVDFGGAIFYFERVELESNPNQNFEEFTGEYFSEELNVTYSFFVENNNLILSYPNNENIIIIEGVQDTFGGNRRTKYAFIRNNEGRITSFQVASEGTVKEILFEKVN